MQTFLPVPVFKECGQYLDRERCGKQRAEVKQIFEGLMIREGRIWSHPATQMWVGHEDALLHYGMAICDAWCSRGYRDSLWVQFRGWLKGPYCEDQSQLQLPPWLGSPKLHASHRSNLLRKLPNHYSQFGWTEPATLPYFWPDANYDWRKYEQSFHARND